MRRILSLAAAAAILCAGTAGAYKEEPQSFGDMHWGDSVKKVRERYAVQYLEETRGGGALYAVNFSDFREILGIRGPITVMGAFDSRGKLTQINVPLRMEGREAADRAFADYTKILEERCGAPSERTKQSALWTGKKTNIFVESSDEGILVCFIDAGSMKKQMAGK